MSYYDNFVKTNKNPREKWKEGLQAFVDRGFENASTYYEDVEEETKFGSLEFEPMNVRVNSLVDAKTGQRVNDDYKKLIFPDLDYHPELGTRYRFDDNIWICYSTDNIKTDTAAIYVRRCNNTMNTQDEYGNIHEEPCYIDYKVTENQVFRNYSIDVPSGRIQIQVQLNDWTKNINVNDRFIFGDDAYKIRERSRFDRRNTFSKDSVRYISFYADYDNLSPDDNIDLGVANYRVYNYTIRATSSIDNIVGFSEKIRASVYLDNNDTDEEIEWSSTYPDIADITSDGVFSLKKPGSCSFVGVMKNKKDVRTMVSVVVRDGHKEEYTTVLTPSTNYIRLNQSERYSIVEYKNLVPTDTKFEIKCYDVPHKYYRFTSDDNHFEIKNMKSCEDILLRVVYKNLRTNEENTLLVELGGII